MRNCGGCGGQSDHPASPSRERSHNWSIADAARSTALSRAASTSPRYFTTSNVWLGTSLAGFARSGPDEGNKAASIRSSPTARSPLHRWQAKVNCKGAVHTDNLKTTSQAVQTGRVLGVHVLPLKYPPPSSRHRKEDRRKRRLIPSYLPSFSPIYVLSQASQQVLDYTLVGLSQREVERPCQCLGEGHTQYGPAPVVLDVGTRYIPLIFS